MFIHFSKPLIALLSIMLISSCSQNSQSVKDTFLFSLFSNKDVVLSPEQIQAVPYASIYAVKKNNPRAFLVLLNAEANTSTNRPENIQLKWISASQEMITTEHGRIVKTFNFSDGNLDNSFAEKPDPLALGLLNPTTPKIWLHYADWQPNNYTNIKLNSIFTVANENQQIDINGKMLAARQVIETVSAPDLGISYQNTFWLDPNSQQVIASIQRPAPLLSEIEIQTLKPFIGIN